MLSNVSVLVVCFVCLNVLSPVLIYYMSEPPGAFETAEFLAAAVSDERNCNDWTLSVSVCQCACTVLVMCTCVMNV